MAADNENFYHSNKTRRILVVDDEVINREMLGMMLKDEFDIIYATNGEEALEKMRENRNTLSLVLLDVIMPVKSGIEVLQEIRSDNMLSRIPVIVTTAETRTEEESLDLGAIDFIPKPYPSDGVIKARLRRIIELYEDKGLIQSTSRDLLTGVYNKEYFFNYAKQFENMKMDAAAIDVNHFHLINERFGRSYGDEILKKIGKQLMELDESVCVLAGRRSSDNFMMLCRHGETDYRKILDQINQGLADSESSENKVWVRMGIYPDIDLSQDIEQSFDRASAASDTVKDRLDNLIGVYDTTLHDKEMFAEQLLSDFPAAIAEKQFEVYFQPKFDICAEVPELTSAEALVRWKHPKMGMVSPGTFIPLFEENSLIRELDAYIWRETARQIRKWKDELDFSLQVSVNVSRVDLFDPNLTDNLLQILSDFSLTTDELLLEITESAYTQDSEQIIKTVENLRGLGFKIEMDDFGTGYSSLHMLSSLPIDALKLDMQFIREAFSEGGNTHMLQVVIEIADYLQVPVIAEGVETYQQLDSLKVLGCDIVQGYLFSKPVPASDFEKFITQKKEADHRKALMEEGEIKKEDEYGDDNPQDEINRIRKEKMKAAREGQNSGWKDGTDLTEENSVKQKADSTGTEPEEENRSNIIKLRTASIFILVLSVIIAAALLFADISVYNGCLRMKTASDRYISAQLAASDMEKGSDYLTDRARCFVVTGETEYLKDFVEEVEVTRRRERAVEDLRKLLEDSSSTAVDNLDIALTLSNSLIETEELAMRIMLESGDYDMSEVPESISSIVLSPEDMALSPEEQKAKAQALIFDSDYMQNKEQIRENISLCTQEIILASSQELEAASSTLSTMAKIQTFFTIVFLLIVLGIVVMTTTMVRIPLTRMIKKMQLQEPMTPAGVAELRFVTRTYNKILEENRQAQEKLSHEASHDPLTGLFNRGAYDLWMESVDTKHIALLIMDVDYFKNINDTYGHQMGDRVLKRVAQILQESFRSVDIICRIGGDEFVVVMSRVNSSMWQMVYKKIVKINDILQHPQDDLPPVSLSVGIAFSDRKKPKGDIFTDADSALYKVKEAGKNGCRIY